MSHYFFCFFEFWVAVVNNSLFLGHLPIFSIIPYKACEILCLKNLEQLKLLFLNMSRQMHKLWIYNKELLKILYMRKLCNAGTTAFCPAGKASVLFLNTISKLPQPINQFGIRATKSPRFCTWSHSDFKRAIPGNILHVSSYTVTYQGKYFFSCNYKIQVWIL